MATIAKVNLGSISPVRDGLGKKIFSKVRKIFTSGNYAVAMAALDAGAKFFSGYPITPSTEILEKISLDIFRMRGTYLEMEDEIGGIAAALGASIAGIKSFTATSGPGFSLKQENLGYAAFTEIPLVIINVMRAGPSTGGPTDVAQGDVMQSKWGSHGDYPIIVLSPQSVQECYLETFRAFNLSEKYRTPVILLSDAVIGQMEELIELPPKEALPVINRKAPQTTPEDYLAYQITADGVPPLANFGTGYLQHITGLYHGEDGLPTKIPEKIDALLRRLQAKLNTPPAKKDILKTELFFTEDAEILILAYGVTSRTATEAVIEARRQGTKAGLVRPVTLWPSDTETLKGVMGQDKIRRVIVPELNLGQYVLEVERILKDTQVPVRSLTKVDTRIFTTAELLRALHD